MLDFMAMKSSAGHCQHSPENVAIPTSKIIVVPVIIVKPVALVGRHVLNGDC